MKLIIFLTASMLSSFAFSSTYSIVKPTYLLEDKKEVNIDDPLKSTMRNKTCPKMLMIGTPVKFFKSLQDEVEVKSLKGECKGKKGWVKNSTIQMVP